MRSRSRPARQSHHGRRSGTCYDDARSSLLRHRRDAPPDTPSYVERQADTDLYDALSRGEFCYVLTSRQMGKSSLMARTAARLRAEGVAVAILDLTALGQNLTAEQWYDGLLAYLGQPARPGRRAGGFLARARALGPAAALDARAAGGGAAEPDA